MQKICIIQKKAVILQRFSRVCEKQNIGKERNININLIDVVLWLKLKQKLKQSLLISLA